MRTPTKQAEQFLENLVTELQIPDGRYEAAERSYKSISDWLKRPESTLREYSPSIYPQGSFRLGTVIRPATNKEDYDLDVVCELTVLKTSLTQEQLKTKVGDELSRYAQAKKMERPERSRRCWTINYADGAQFHMDALPAIPDGDRLRLLIETSTQMRAEWAKYAIAITDDEHPFYRSRTENWPSSNPKGFSEWFRSRMQPVFDKRRMALALQEARANVEEIPDYRVRTPLQSAIQLLKRHRDLMFVDRPDDKPISIILTTLAARSYSQEDTISGALYGILAKMDQFVEDRDGVAWISNPTDGRENFADKWVDHPEREESFRVWLQDARADFQTAAGISALPLLVDALAPRMGRQLVESAATRRQPSRGTTALAFLARPVKTVLRQISDAPHRRPLRWTPANGGSVTIRSASYTQKGFRPVPFPSDGPAISKHCSLQFEASTTVPPPYRVYWQVTNTGSEARAANGLRGGFYETAVERGKLTRRESTLYRGTHGIECFIVKNGYCVARSGLFLVNIQ